MKITEKDKVPEHGKLLAMYLNKLQLSFDKTAEILFYKYLTIGFSNERLN